LRVTPASSTRTFARLALLNTRKNIVRKLEKAVAARRCADRETVTVGEIVDEVHVCEKTRTEVAVKRSLASERFADFEERAPFMNSRICVTFEEGGSCEFPRITESWPPTGEGGSVQPVRHSQDRKRGTQLQPIVHRSGRGPSCVRKTRDQYRSSTSSPWHSSAAQGRGSVISSRFRGNGYVWKESRSSLEIG
jgi:hypothetical protein